MLGGIIDRSMDTWVYHEHDRRAFRDDRLRTGDVDRLDLAHAASLRRAPRPDSVSA